MPTLNKREFEAGLLKALRLDGRAILDITIRIRPTQMPTVTIIEIPEAAAGEEVLALLGRYTLVPCEGQPAADLGATGGEHAA